MRYWPNRTRASRRNGAARAQCDRDRRRSGHRAAFRAAAEADRARFSRLCDADRAGHPGSARRHAALLPDAQSPISPDLCRRRTRRDASNCTAYRPARAAASRDVRIRVDRAAQNISQWAGRESPPIKLQFAWPEPPYFARYRDQLPPVEFAAPPTRCGSRATCSTGRCRSPTKSRTGRRSCRWARTRRCVRRKAISSNACARSWHAGPAITRDRRRSPTRCSCRPARCGAGLRRRFELSAIARRSAVSRREAVAHRVGSRPEDDRRTAAIHRPGELHARVPALGRANAECVS